MRNHFVSIEGTCLYDCEVQERGDGVRQVLECTMHRRRAGGAELVPAMHGKVAAGDLDGCGVQAVGPAADVYASVSRGS